MTSTKKTRQTRASVTPTAPAAARKAAAPRSTARPAAKPAPRRVAKSPVRTTAKAAIVVAPDVSKAKPKLVRDSFTIPKSEYAVLEGLKQRAASLTRPAKKSELLRAGIAVLNGLNDQAFLAALNGVPSLKTGRPKNSASNAE